MAFHISVQPSGKTFDAEAGETLLDAALRQGLLMPYGCRDGACGACRGRVLSGQIDHGKALTHALSEADRADGWALFCSATAHSDLSIESRDLRSNRDIPVRTLPARVQTLRRLAPDVMLVELRLPASERLAFLAGQYIEILLKEGRRRAFSLANAPHDDATLQLHVRHVPGGLFTGHVFDGMQARDMVRLSGPHGTFFLREDSPKPMLLVAGGTGFAPLKAIVEHALAERSPRPMNLYWGGRTRADLYLHELAAGWARAHPHVRYVPVLSAATAEDDWPGRSGLVHHAVMQDFPDLSGHQVYVCGSPAMVAAARADFIGRCGLPDNEFFADSFEYSGDGRAASGLPD